MAKPIPTLTLRRMEGMMGYNLLDWPSDLVECFDSNLNRVADDLHGKTRMEYRKFRETGPARCAQKASVKTFGSDNNTITITQISQTTIHRYWMDIRCFEVNLSLLLTEEEASQAEFVARRWHEKQSDSVPESAAPFFRLPPEMRETIYALSVPETEWEITDLEAFEATQFPRAIGDPTGFYFPLSEDLGLLRVNKQMREESLHLAYQRTFFKVNYMEDIVKLLVSIGKTGRENIESLECFWVSRAEANLSILPSRHVDKITELLKRCKRLKFLRVIFELRLPFTMSVSDLQADPVIEGLSSLEHIERVEIQVSPHEHHLAGLLREMLERPIQGGDRS